MKPSSILLTLLLLTLLGISCNDHTLVPQPLQVFDLATKVEGKGYSELVQEATKVIFSQSIDGGPLSDDATGTRHAPALQPVKNVTILHSNFGGTTRRSLTIPSGNYVFLYVIASTYFYFENDGCNPTFKPAPGQTLADFLKANADDGFKELDGLVATLDGQPIVSDLKQYRVTTPIHKLTIHPDYLDLKCDYTGQQASVLDDGIYLLLKLPKGKHTLTYGGAYPAYSFETFMTWNLTVE